MVPGGQRDDLDLAGFEAAEPAVLDQVIRVFVMALVADVGADVVEQGPVLEPFPLIGAKAVVRDSLVKYLQRQPGDLLGMVRQVVAALAEFDDAAPADVGIPFDLLDMGAVPLDVVEDEPFAQGVVAQRELFDTEFLEQRVEQHGPGHGQVGAFRVEPRHLQALDERRPRQLTAQPMQRLGGDAKIPDAIVCAAAAGQFAERKDRA